MKRFLIALLALFLFVPTVVAENATEFVVEMTYIVKMPNVIREGSYTGEISNGIPNGYGIFTSFNSEGIRWHYVGNWVDGAMCGEGGCYWDSGQSQIGTYENNQLILGTTHSNPSYSYWVDYRLDEEGCYKAKQYRADGTLLFDGCVDSTTHNYHKGTIYTGEGKVFFSGEIGEGFDWNLLYID